MFPLNSNTPYIKDTGERARLGQIVGGSDTPELPDYGVADAGKVLTVGEDGSLEWDTKGSGGGDAFVSYDFTKIGNFTIGGIAMSEDGAEFTSANYYFTLVPSNYKKSDITLYVDTGDFVIIPGSSHQRFIVGGGNGNSGLIWRYTDNTWSIYDGSNWITSEITDLSFFDNCTIKIYIDASRKWHVYKNNTLALETSTSISSDGGITIGSTSGQSISQGFIKAARVYNGNYTE